jgi:hypothetical protein
VQDHRPLRREADLGHGCHRPADDNARQPGVEQADPLNIRARKERPECAAKNIGRAKQQHELDAGSAAETAGRVIVELTVQQEPSRDICAADQGQQAPPPGNGI